MIQINLLPVRQIKERIRSRNELLALIAGLFVILLLLAAIMLNQKGEIATLNAKATELTKEKEKYTPIIKQIKESEKEKEALQVKLDVIKNLRANSQMPVRIMDEISNLTPPSRIWLKTLSLKGKSIRLNGIALDNETIAQYMTRIMESPYFTKAVLEKSSLENIGGQKLKSFGMTIDIQQPHTPAAAAPKKEKK